MLHTPSQRLKSTTHGRQLSYDNFICQLKQLYTGLWDIIHTEKHGGDVSVLSNFSTVSDITFVMNIIDCFASRQLQCFLNKSGIQGIYRFLLTTSLLGGSTIA